MKRFYQNNTTMSVFVARIKEMSKMRGRAIVVALTLMTLVVSCVNTSDFYGNNFVPPSQEMNTLIDSGGRVNTSVIALDSIVTSLTGYPYIGVYQDPVFGRTTTEILTSFVPSGFDNEDVRFGVNPVLDSLKAYLYFIAPVGDSNSKLKVSMHQIKDLTLKYTSTYYSNFDASNYYDPTPIAQFEVTGSDSIVVLNLPQSFYSQLLNNNPDREKNPYFNDTLFIDTYKGFYFRVEDKDPPASSEGVMYSLNIYSSNMLLYYHNKNEEPDTTYMGYSFIDTYEPAGNNFFTITHDYDFADPSQGGINVNLIGDSTTSVATQYIQGMGGLGSRVEIDTNYIESIKKEAIDKGYSHVALQRASIKWQIKDKTPESYNDAASRLGLYYSYDYSSFIKEYNPTSEALSQSYSSEIGGTINRSNGYYEQVITSSMQKLFNKPSDVPYTINGNYNYVMQLFPAADEMYLYSGVLLGGSESVEYEPKLVIVYTLIK